MYLVLETALTSVSDTETLKMSKSIDDYLGANANQQTPPIKMHEKKALNFLVNEYLLQNDYKLTGVCFSDEVADQVCIHSQKCQQCLQLNPRISTTGTRWALTFLDQTIC